MGQFQVAEIPGRESKYPTYRGVSRAGIRYFPDLAEDHELNALWYASSDSEDRITYFLRNLNIARKIVTMYERHRVEGKFEIIEIVRNRRKPLCGTEFLGYDVVIGLADSCILSYLRIDNYGSPALRDEARQLEQRAMQLVHVNLNENGLFNTFEAARKFLICTHKQTLFDLVNIPEHERSYCRDARILGLYKVLDKRTPVTSA